MQPGPPHGRRSYEHRASLLARTQGWYYVLTGLWPLVHYRSFIAVTGPKTDNWAVLTVAALVAVTGAVLIASSRRGRVGLEIGLLAFGQAAVLAMADVLSVALAGVSRVYLLDAVTELGFTVVWIAAWNLAKRAPVADSGNKPDHCT